MVLEYRARRDFGYWEVIHNKEETRWQLLYNSGLMNELLRADEVLSKLEKLRDDRYDTIRMWMKMMGQATDVERIQELLPHLEKAVYQCEALDHLLHDCYIGLKQVAEKNVT